MTRRKMDNPPNPYLSEQRDWLEPPPPALVEVYEENARSILSENNSPDIPFRWSVNPYRGCQHACAYCYARPTHEYLGLGAGSDFDTKLIAKINAPALLRAAFSKRGWAHERVCFSGVTDCYQPIEAVYRLTRGCLEVCLEFQNQVSIITKSRLVMRDIDILAQLQRAGGASVYQSIPFADDKTAKLIEPQAPPPSKRFEAMRSLADAGIPVGVMVAPVIPGLNDSQIPEILRRAAEAGATSAAFTALHLPGSAAPVFLSRVQEAMPDKAAKIESLIREMRGGQLDDSRFVRRMTGEGEYWQNIKSLFRLSARRHGLSATGKKTTPKKPRRRNSLKRPSPQALRHEPPRPSQMLFGFAEA